MIIFTLENSVNVMHVCVMLEFRIWMDIYFRVFAKKQFPPYPFSSLYTGKVETGVYSEHNLREVHCKTSVMSIISHNKPT